MMAARLGDANSPIDRPMISSSVANAWYGKSTGRSSSTAKAPAVASMPSGGESPGPVAVGEDPGGRPGDEEPDRQGEHVDARPQRRLLEAVSVAGQPDPLQPDDQHELQAAPDERREEGREVSGGERSDLEQTEAEHGVGDLGLDAAEHGQHGQRRRRSSPRTNGLVQPIGWPPYGWIP